MLPIISRAQPGVAAPLGSYSGVHLDLSQVMYQKEFDIAGNWLYVLRTSGKQDNTAVIQFNGPSGGQSVLLQRGMKYRLPFQRFYITNSGQSGAFADVYIGHSDQTDLEWIQPGEFATQTEGYDSVGGVWVPIRSRTYADGLQFETGPDNALLTIGASMLYKPGAANWDRPRTPETFKGGFVAGTGVGNTALWTPAAGKKFRLMGFNFVHGGIGAWTLTDGNAGQILAGGASSFETVMQHVFPGNGYLSQTANNVLFINTAVNGSLNYEAYGTEE